MSGPTHFDARQLVKVDVTIVSHDRPVLLQCRRCGMTWSPKIHPGAGCRPAIGSAGGDATGVKSPDVVQRPLFALHGDK